MEPDKFFERIKADAKKRYPNDLLYQEAHCLGALMTRYRAMFQELTKLKESNHASQSLNAG